MTIVMGNCATCDGTGQERYPNPGPHPCYTCKGFKVLNASGRGYASQATADRGIATGHASQCYICKGTGVMVTPEFHKCYHCDGIASEILSFDPGDVIPPGFGSLTRSAVKGSMAHYAATVNVVVTYHDDKVLTWGASHLGLGTIVSCTDYGRAYDARDAAALESKVRHELATGHHQFCKFTDDATRTVADTVMVDVTRNGYTVTTAASVAGASRAMLPPTYTAEKLNGPP